MPARMRARVLPGDAKNAVREISTVCFSRKGQRENTRLVLESLGLKPAKTIADSQFRMFNGMVEELAGGSDHRSLDGAEKYARQVQRLLGKKEFRQLVREAIIKRNRRGVTSIKVLYDWRAGFIRSMVEFTGNPKPGELEAAVEKVLRNEKLRAGMIERMAEDVSNFSSRGRFWRMTKDLIEQLKLRKITNPVIIDYGTGTGEQTLQLQKDLKKAGIKANILATDKRVAGEAAKNMRGSKVALATHDLRRNSFLGRFRKGPKVKADVVRLGLVLQYSLQENVGKMIRNAMKDVREGGLIVVSMGATTTHSIYEKIDSEHVRRIVPPVTPMDRFWDELEIS
jgi:hypothetical protein